MNDRQVSEPEPQAANNAAGGRRVGRRSVMKAGVATVAGLAIGTTYLKPGVISVGVQEVYAFSYQEPTQESAPFQEPTQEFVPYEDTTQESVPSPGKKSPVGKKDKKRKGNKKLKPQDFVV